MAPFSLGKQVGWSLFCSERIWFFLTEGRKKQVLVTTNYGYLNSNILHEMNADCITENTSIGNSVAIFLA